MRQILVTSHRKAEVIETPDMVEPLKPQEVRGRALVSLISPGTELNYAFLEKEGFPKYPGYASILEVEEVGADVTDIAAGALALATTSHADLLQCSRNSIAVLPPDLKPEIAVFARLMGVGMSTLNTTTARPPCRVLVTGLGPVGNLAAQVFSACGYAVTAVDPAESRRQAATLSGLKDVRATVAEGLPDVTGQVALHLECSGHEKAVLDGCNAVRKRGEVVLVGVPWSRRTEIYSFELLQAVFRRYAVLRSGWEWEVPRQPRDFCSNSIIENYAAALDWLAEGKVNVEHLGGCYSPTQIQEVYEGLLSQTLPTTSALIDWRRK